MIGFIGAILGTRSGAIAAAFVVVGLALFTWHKVDRSSAVRRAVAEYVADVELTAARVQLEEVKRRQAVTTGANRRLQSEIQTAEADAEAATEELDHYVSTVADSCTVQPDLVDRLRNR